MVGTLQRFYAERGVQMEPTAGYNPEANGIAERHHLTLLDMALPMLADSGLPQYGLCLLGPQYAGEAVMYANDLHNATPASGGRVRRTLYEGFLARTVILSVFRRFGCRVLVHKPGRQHTYRHKLAPRRLPGRFLSFQRPFGSGVYRVQLDSGRIMVS
jgi:hypothetical protein